MMKKNVAIGLLFSILLTSHASVAEAIYVNTPACQQETYALMEQEKHVERSIIFGQRDSRDSKVGDVRFDMQGNAWMKKDTNSWHSLTKDNPISDGLMDEKADAKPRRGLLEQKRTSTSDLIPTLTQTFRAYQCRLRSVCAAANDSQQESSLKKTTITVQSDGCEEAEMPVLKNCNGNTQVTASVTSCDDAIGSILAQEEQMLVLLVTYDSAYRTLLQFQGVFEGFLTSFRFALVNPIWQTVRVIGGLNHIPCFTSQCDE